MEPRRISSRDNALLQRVRKLVRDPGAYRQLGEVWLEGEHLCNALEARGGRAAHALIAETAWARPALAGLAATAYDVVVVPDKLFGDLSALPSPAGIGFLHALPAAPSVDAGLASIVLDRVQDAGNVGSILRSASALGVRQVLALQGTAGLWSAKVLRAGMGAQFGMRLVEGLRLPDLDALAIPWVATSPHAAAALPEAVLPSPCVWVFGHEGQGAAAELIARCALTVRIPQPGGEESLNVAAAAAICLYESARRAALL
ncbi:MAG TPA: RNA methyltransferase [Rubrivivax sp.]